MSITSLSIFFSDKKEICIFNLLNIFPNLENLEIEKEGESQYGNLQILENSKCKIKKLKF